MENLRLNVKNLCYSHFIHFIVSENASRYCLPNGTWFVHASINSSSASGWTNFMACFANITTPEYEDDQFDLGVANMVLVSNTMTVP